MLKAIRFDAVDAKIIQSLQSAPQGSVAKIATKLRLPISTTRHRIRRLVRTGVIEFAVLTNPLFLGYQIWAVLEIQAEIGKIRAVANALAAIPQVYFVGIVTGGYDIYAAAVFRSNAEMLDFATQRLSRIPGLIRTSTASILELVKRSMTFGLLDGFAVNGERRRASRTSAARRKERAAGKRLERRQT